MSPAGGWPEVVFFSHFCNWLNISQVDKREQGGPPEAPAPQKVGGGCPIKWGVFNYFSFGRRLASSLLKSQMYLSQPSKAGKGASSGWGMTGPPEIRAQRWVWSDTVKQTMNQI
jgi:hypothetical protein